MAGKGAAEVKQEPYAVTQVGNGLADTPQSLHQLSMPAEGLQFPLCTWDTGDTQEVA